MSVARGHHLTHDELKASGLGLGALHFGVFLNQKDSTHLIHAALDRGIKFIDTAPIYGGRQSETIVGDAVVGRRDQVIIATKVGLVEKPRPDGTFGVELAPLTAKTIGPSLDRSLKFLRTDYVDLLQLHAFDHATPFEDTLGALEELMRAGKVRAIGCSNYSPAELGAATRSIGSQDRMPFATAQCHYNIIERRAETLLIPNCEESGIGVICNRALARGVLTGKYHAMRPLPSGSRGALSKRIRQELKKETLDLVTDLVAWAGQRGRTAAELALAWLESNSAVSLILIGVRNVEQLAACARARDWKLNAEDLSEIDAIIHARGLSNRVRELPEKFFET